MNILLQIGNLHRRNIRKRSQCIDEETDNISYTCYSTYLFFFKNGYMLEIPDYAPTINKICKWRINVTIV